MIFKIIPHFITITVLFVIICDGWRAVPANQAMYAYRSARVGDDRKESKDQLLPRTHLHSIYKFGYCKPDVIKRQFLHKTSNFTLVDWQATQANYLYLLERKNTQRFRLQCIVMKMYVPKRYLFRRGRIPMYYCQGFVIIMMFQMIQKMELHEFFIHSKLNMPANFAFEFYHPTPI